MILRKHLSADNLFSSLRTTFEKVPDLRRNNRKISLPDALMSGFAVFSLKDPSLLAFEERRNDEDENSNLKTIYGMENIPSDTQMREILDPVDPGSLRPAFKTIFRQLQRGKALEQMAFYQGHYLLSLDGTQYFVSKNLSSPSCMEKVNKKTREVTYYQQMLGAAVVNPHFKEVIPLCPEMIIKQDGETKNDCERNAARRWLEKFRKDHPHLKVIVTEDALASNAPHIKDLKRHKCHFILGVKPGDHNFLFDFVDEARQRKETTEFEFVDDKNTEITHRFRFLNDAPLNESNQDVRVNFLEYWQISDKKTLHFSWVIDFTVTKDNCYALMRGGRSRWKIENETFNTLKNQGYNLEHNYGLGKKYLSVIFVMLMMLAFLVDQVQQLCCALFNSLWEKLGSKRALWERIRNVFHFFKFKSMEMLYRFLLSGIKLEPPDTQYS